MAAPVAPSGACAALASLYRIGYVQALTPGTSAECTVSGVVTIRAAVWDIRWELRPNRALVGCTPTTAPSRKLLRDVYFAGSPIMLALRFIMGELAPYGYPILGGFRGELSCFGPSYKERGIESRVAQSEPKTGPVYECATLDRRKLLV